MTMEFLRSHRNILIILLFSIVPLYSLFNPELLYTQDGWTHLIRGSAYFKGLINLNIPVRWAGDLNFGYGMPIFIFVFQLPYQLFSMLIGLGFDFSTSFKILLFASYALSGLFMYLFAKELFEDESKALIVTFFYQFFPYRLVDLVLRGSIGETFAFIFLPLILLGIVRMGKKVDTFSILCITTGTAFLTLSHLATGGVFMLLVFLFIVLFIKTAKKVLAIVASILFGLMLSAYYLIPALLEHKYTYGDLFAKNLYVENFAPFSKLFALTIFNTPSIRIGDVPVSIGVTHLVLLTVLIGSIFYFKKFKKIERKIIIFAIIISAASLFMMTKMSFPLWSQISIIRQFQFPWRFLAPLGFSLALFGGVAVGLLHKKSAFFVVVLITVISTISFWVPPLGYKKVDDMAMRDYPLTTTYFGETDVIWSGGPATSYPKNRVEVISGEGKIKNFKKSNAEQKFIFDASLPSRLVSHTQYFPGWRVSVGDASTPIQFQDPNHRGEITFDVPKGRSQVVVKFVEDKVRLVSNLLTVLALLCLFPFIKILKKFSL